jgi:uncharacterized protein YlxP (DUF503 family)
MKSESWWTRDEVGPMIVSMIQFRIELPPLQSIKDKRRIVSSLKEKLSNKFPLSVAEVDLQDSMRYAQIGAALVTNSKTFGESLMHKVLRFVENNCEGVLADAEIFSETF